jgi:hypothetical protein
MSITAYRISVGDSCAKTTQTGQNKIKNKNNLSRIRFIPIKVLIFAKVIKKNKCTSKNSE